MKTLILLSAIAISPAMADCGGFDCLNYDLTTMTFEEYQEAKRREQQEQQTELENMKQNLVQEDDEEDE